MDNLLKEKTIVLFFGGRSPEHKVSINSAKSVHPLLNKLFKKHTGTNVYKYILYKRIQYAKNYLERGFSVQETCNLSGFNDYANFIKCFKNKMGLSPGKYKNQSK